MNVDKDFIPFTKIYSSDHSPNCKTQNYKTHESTLIKA